MTFKTQSQQPQALEDAVLTLLGEQEFGPAEVTQPGTAEWGLLEKVEEETRARPAPKKRKTLMVKIGLPERRSANELPWALLTDSGAAP